MDSRNREKRVLVICGEASGDFHGALLVRAMLRKDPNLAFWGIGGQELEKAGVRILMSSEAISVVGFTEVFAKLPDIFKGRSLAKRLMETRRPDLLVLIDFPDFNLHMARIARKLGIPVLYYISPQIWAWRSGRIRKIRERVTHMAVILPFEEELYRRENVPVTYVGHPLLDLNRREDPDTPPAARSGREKVIGLLPGSRGREISRHLPLMLEAAAILNRRLDGLKFLLSVAPSTRREGIWDLVRENSTDLDLELVYGGAGSILDRAGFAIAASGTVTLETAIAGVPMIIIYKVSRTSFLLGKALVQVGHIGLANLIAGREIVPELIQERATAENIADEAMRILTDPLALDRQRGAFQELRARLGNAGASERTAEIALSLMDGSTQAEYGGRRP